MYNIYENNKKNRWSYESGSDKVKFISAIHIISLAAVLQYLLFKELPEIIYGIFGFIVYGTGILESDFFYFMSYEEIDFIFYNIMSIITTLTVCFLTCVFIILCMRKFVLKQDVFSRNRENNKIPDKVTVKFKLPENTFALLITGICIIEFSAVIYMLFNFFLNKVFSIVPVPPSEFQLYFPRTGFGIVLYFISLVIIPPVAEEFVCRYVMLNALKKYGNGFAIIATSLFFGFMHARVNAFIYATLMGVFLAYIAIKTKSIWFPVIMHAIVNGVSFMFQWLYSLPGFEYSAEVIYAVFLCIIAIICIIYLITLIIRRKEIKLKKPVDYAHITNRNKLLFFFNVASVLFFILVILRSTEDYVFQSIKIL